MDSPTPTGQADISTIHLALEHFGRLHHWVAVSDNHGRALWTSNELMPNDVLTALESAPAFLELLLPMADSRENTRIEDHLAQMNREPSSEGEPSDGRLEFEGIAPTGGRFVLYSSWTRLPSGQPILVNILDPIDENALISSGPTRVGDGLASAREMPSESTLFIDPTGFILALDPIAREMLGWPDRAQTPRPITALLPHSAELVRWLSALPAEPRQFAEEVEIALPKGSTRWISLASRPHRGQLSGHRVNLSDVSRYVSKNRELARKNAELESQLHSLSHGLRSPLVTLLGFIRLLRDDYEDVVGEEGSGFMDRIERAGMKINSQIDDLLKLSRIKLDEEQRSLVDLRELLTQLDAELKLQFDDQGSRLVLPAAIPMVLCERNHLYQIFYHLIVNAIEHMGECNDHRVEIRVEETGPNYRIHVRDNGPGVPGAELDRIFDAFYSRAKPGPERQFSGMGLAIVRKIAQLHGGTAWAESEPGQGASFYVTLSHN